MLKSSEEPTPVRIQKYLAECGLGSRREAERWIEEGKITVNGQPATLGQKIIPGKDFIKVGRKPVLPRQSPEPLTLALHKPRGVICSHHDPHHEHTIYDLLPPAYQKIKLMCAGRLDKDSEGLLILTNDGALCNRITHPSHAIIKRYRVTLNRTFDPAKIPAMLDGVTDDGERLYAHKIIPDSHSTLRLEIHLAQGRKREVRRLMEAFGYHVKRLKRIQIGHFQLKGIPRGTTIKLSERDIAQLFS